MTPADLEAFVHRQLKALPCPPAPHTLLPRLMTAIQRRLERPWYARSLFTWPLAGQAACIVALLVVVGGVALWLPIAHDTAGNLLLSPLGNETQRIATAAARVSVAVNTIEVLRRTLIEPLYAYAAILILTMYATSAVLAAALARVALGGAIRP
jgi:hypothetical protein